MRIADPFFDIIQLPAPDVLELIESIGRVCYKSEDKMVPGTAQPFIARILSSGHESVIEHASITVRIICDRGVTHELVRHRLCSFTQESTRYANYAHDRFGNEITVIRPYFFEEGSLRYLLWEAAMLACERAYLDLVKTGATAQEARSVLPNSLKTEIIMTANIREWRHIFKLRCAKAAHPQMREIMLPMLAGFAAKVPFIFDDILKRHLQEEAETRV
jgi:thymidylate synthase (FAD)